MVMKGNLQRKESLLAKYLKNYRERFSRKDASQLLHSMATSKDILFWTPKVVMLYEYSQTRRVYSSNLQPRRGKADNTKHVSGWYCQNRHKQTTSEKKKPVADLVLWENEMRTSRGLDGEYESDTSSQDNDESEVSESEQDEESECEDENGGDADAHSVDRKGTEDDLTSCQNCSGANICHAFLLKC